MPKGRMPYRVLAAIVAVLGLANAAAAMPMAQVVSGTEDWSIDYAGLSLSATKVPNTTGVPGPFALRVEFTANELDEQLVAGQPCVIVLDATMPIAPGAFLNGLSLIDECPVGPFAFPMDLPPPLVPIECDGVGKQKILPPPGMTGGGPGDDAPISPEPPVPPAMGGAPTPPGTPPPPPPSWPLNTPATYGGGSSTDAPDDYGKPSFQIKSTVLCGSYDNTPGIGICSGAFDSKRGVVAADVYGEYDTSTAIQLVWAALSSATQPAGTDVPLPANIHVAAWIEVTIANHLEPCEIITVTMRRWKASSSYSLVFEDSGGRLLDLDTTVSGTAHGNGWLTTIVTLERERNPGDWPDAGDQLSIVFADNDKGHGDDGRAALSFGF